jgi:hypothetical protein
MLHGCKVGIAGIYKMEKYQEHMILRLLSPVVYHFLPPVL